MHQVTGVLAAHPAQAVMHNLPHYMAPAGFAPPLAPQPAPYPSPPPHLSVGEQQEQQHLVLGLKVDLQQQHPGLGGGVGDAGFHPVPMASRAAFASSGSAGQSSGYASGSALVLSTPSAAYGASSAFSGSCGYSGNSHPHLPSPAAHMYDYNAYSGSTQRNSGDYVDAPALTGPQVSANLPVSSRHSRQRPFPPSQHRSSADFPFIDDDDAATLSPVYLGGEHACFVNVQGEPGRGRGRGGSPAITETLRSEGSAVPFEGGMPRMMQELRPGTAGLGGGRVGHPSSSSSGMVHRPSQQQSSDMMRFSQATPSQPATAVMAMLNTSSAMDVSQQKMQGGQYPPLSVVGKASAVGMSWVNQAKSIPNKPPDSNGHRLLGQSHSQPVYHPPTSSPLPFERYGDSTGGSTSVSQSEVPPTFAQIAAAGRRTDSAGLLARQAQAGLGSQEKGQLAKAIISSGRSGSGSSSEVILREKVGVKPGGPVRGSSLVAPSRAAGGGGQDQGFSRQSSQSMDLGMLKWRCRACTMENSAVETICSACSKSKNIPDLPFPAAGESKRVCPACTFENQPGNSICEMCTTVLTDVHTYV